MLRYRIMWLLVLFDLPTVTHSEKKRAAKFRKQLLHSGFGMIQYSVYERYFISMEKAEVYIKRIENWLPIDGHVTILPIPDKTYAKRRQFCGTALRYNKPPPEQLTFF